MVQVRQPRDLRWQVIDEMLKLRVPAREAARAVDWVMRETDCEGLPVQVLLDECLTEVWRHEWMSEKAARLAA